MTKLIKILMVSFLFYSGCCSSAIRADNQETFSPIEKIFLDESKEALRQFGYDIFESKAGFIAPTDIAVGPDYLLGPGDEIVINLWGLFEEAYRETIDRDGAIFLPKLGKITLSRRTFSEVEKNLKEKFNQYYKNVHISITLGKIRTIRIFVIGEVKQPGSYQMSALSNLLDALCLAGGPNKTGTLRNIKLIKKEGQKLSFDLYRFLLSGENEGDFYLSSGDTVFVPSVGSVVAISGKVKRPAIYELKEKTPLKDLIEIAGGFLPSAEISRIQIERIENFQKKVLLDVDLSPQIKEESLNILLKDNDLVKVFSIEKRIYDRISLEGLVKHPGNYQLKPLMRLREFLAPEELLPEASPDKAEIIRLKEDGSTEIIGFSPEKLFKGDKEENIALKRWDRIVIRSAWESLSKVQIKGEVKFPGQYTVRKGEKCSSLIQRAGGYLPEAFLSGAVFTRVSVKEKEKERLKEFIQRHTIILEKEKNGATDEETGLIAEGESLLKELTGKVPLGRIVFHLSSLKEFKGSADDLILEDGDTVYIPKPPAAISILGEVNNPTAICYQEGKDINYYLEKVGGFSEHADKKYLYIIRPDGTAITKPSLIGRGDTIIVPQKIRTRTGKIIKDIIQMIYQISVAAS
ncbi:MAG: hypothetical protein COZ37_05025 [bacterium (Candidatus Ratteibacteria) CG_4_10_14_3_um_filter_41_18]|uniref:Soluble ligand binding domain-containing protein n=4 Tax=Candidatus Ratteibacteria TaxID=2979319 RepID=A0A2M7E8L3_9BACT|nr:MAG: hypothetical protein AUJ76_01715 [Candidatus Omnitrophica bacterium CG1_02_41_171]PIV64044.1 MAG: hypothetical protein COS11_04230 [bacterium (Candidatus Ratteibacteria) CG01_land_8_20_14_3_00_40_19]PIW32108.1 MAG: hypothetical protein COW28_06585 [bacterium (Candidatus Ratteibacteria) CG15_BIG_FIL_POST_REV_8_21_14_020_41_12]PIW74304.1 MAG: hypothetical protein CO004_01385 [bacterium (Candidatus Ratteibacteria) CG_4_8_14_3_um_filter_41_36]PIX76990.1 MAG: hypothetical protein COZ37_05025